MAKWCSNCINNFNIATMDYPCSDCVKTDNHPKWEPKEKAKSCIDVVSEMYPEKDPLKIMEDQCPWRYGFKTKHIYSASVRNCIVCWTAEAEMEVVND